MCLCRQWHNRTYEACFLPWLSSRRYVMNGLDHMYRSFQNMFLTQDQWSQLCEDYLFFKNDIVIRIFHKFSYLVRHCSSSCTDNHTESGQLYHSVPACRQQSPGFDTCPAVLQSQSQYQLCRRCHHNSDSKYLILLCSSSRWSDWRRRRTWCRCS